MHRRIIFDQAQARDYDILHGFREILYGLGQVIFDLLGQSGTVVTGLGASPSSPASMVVGLAQGDIYSLTSVDATAYGSIPLDNTLTMQQGFAAAQSVTLSTSGLGVGQSRWALISAAFSQTDTIPGDDPTGGILNYFNSANPTIPLVGPNGNNTAQNTQRQGLCTISVSYGAVASTGSEVPPNAPASSVGCYLVDLIFGQSTVTAPEILVAGPSVGNNVPNNYPIMPTLAGLLSSHHGGTLGQAPKIKMTELNSVSSSNSGSGLGALYVYAGNPNGFVAGVAGAAGVSPCDFCINITGNILYFCTTTGNAASAVWTPVTGTNVNFAGGTSTGTANAQTINPLTPAGFSLTAGYTVTFTPGITNTGSTTLAAGGTSATTCQKVSSGSLVNFSGSEFTVNVPVTLTFNGTVWVLNTNPLGALAYLGAGNYLSALSGNLYNTLPALEGYLQYTNTTTLTLLPIAGGALWINGYNYPIPASLTVSNSGLSANTTYYIYAYMSSGTMTLEVVATGHTANANGIPQKTGDASRTLVGQATTAAGSAVFQAQYVGTLSYWQRRLGSIACPQSTGQSTSSDITYVELSTSLRQNFCCWADDVVTFNLVGTGYNNTSGNSFGCFPAVDGAVVGNGGSGYSAAGGQGMVLATIATQLFAEGYHYVTQFAAIANTGTGYFFCQVFAQIRG